MTSIQVLNIYVYALKYILLLKYIFDCGTILIVGGAHMAVITIRNVDDGTNQSLISMAKKRGLSREEFLRRHLESLTANEEVKEVEERYRVLVSSLIGKLQELNLVMEKNTIVLEDNMELINQIWKVKTNNEQIL